MRGEQLTQARAAGRVRQAAARRGRHDQEAPPAGALPPGAQPEVRRHALHERQAVRRHGRERLRARQGRGWQSSAWAG